MALTRDLILGLAGSDRAARMEAESRTWLMTCPACGAEQSVWDAGGVRYRAASAGKRSLARCGTCGKRFFARLERRPSS